MIIKDVGRGVPVEGELSNPPGHLPGRSSIVNIQHDDRHYDGNRCDGHNGCQVNSCNNTHNRTDLAGILTQNVIPNTHIVSFKLCENKPH